MQDVFKQMLTTIENHEHKLASEEEGHLSVNEAIALGYAFDFEHGEITGYYGSHNKLTLPKTIASCEVRGIAENAFNNCGLKEVYMPAGIMVIREGAFAYNQLTYVKLPDDVISIRDGAFYGNNLSTIEIPNSIMYLLADEFYHGSPSIEEIRKLQQGEF